MLRVYLQDLFGTLPTVPRRAFAWRRAANTSATSGLTPEVEQLPTPDLAPTLFVESPSPSPSRSDKNDPSATAVDFSPAMQPPSVAPDVPANVSNSAAPDAAPEAEVKFEEGDIFGIVRKEKQRDPRGALFQVREGPDGALFLTKDAIFCCSLQNKARKSLIWLITWKWFDRFIMSIILVNAVFMGLADYSVVDDSGNPFPTDFRDGRTSPMNTIIEGLDPTFTGIYCVEMAIKIVALGFFIGPNTYLRDGWNVLDFVAVVTSVAALIPGIPNVSSLRTLRVLRPLRSLKMLPGMKVIIDSMLMAIEPLGNVVVLLIAVFVIFGILATQLFMGIQHQRCRLTPYPVLLQVGFSI